MKQGKIVFRNSKFDPRTGRQKQFVDEKTQWFCGDSPCHAHEQMTHEG